MCRWQNDRLIYLIIIWIMQWALPFLHGIHSRMADCRGDRRLSVIKVAIRMMVIQSSEEFQCELQDKIKGFLYARNGLIELRKSSVLIHYDATLSNIPPAPASNHPQSKNRTIWSRKSKIWLLVWPLRIYGGVSFIHRNERAEMNWNTRRNVQKVKTYRRRKFNWNPLANKLLIST